MLSSVFLFIFGASGAGAAEKGSIEQKDDGVYQMDSTVITATMTEKTLFEVPANVTVITSKDIQEKNVVTVTDILKDAPGIFVERPKGIADSSGGIQIRGFGESSILVLYDGVPVNSAYSGSVDWSSIPIDTIDRIEIAKGAASSLYGGRAVGGVINIITAAPENRDPKVKVYGYYGTNNTWRRGLSVKQRLNDKFSYYLGYEHQSTDGFSNKVSSSTSSGSANPTKTIGTGLVVSSKVDGKPRYIIGSPGNGAGESDIYNLKLNYDFDKDKNISYSYTHNKFKYWTEDPVTYIHDAEGNPLYAGSVQLPNGKWYNFSESAFTDYYGRRTTDIHALRYADNKNNFYLNFGVTDTKESGYSKGSYFDGTTPGSDVSYPSRVLKANLLKTWETSEKNTLTAGIDWQNQRMTRTSSNLAHWHDHDSITSVNYVEGGKNDIFALFLQNDYCINDQWELYAGVRFDHYKNYDGYHNSPEKTILYNETSYDEISPKIALQYHADDETSYYLSYGHSFNPPSIYQLYRSDGTYIGNPNLKPEISDTFEIGMKKKINDKTVMNLSLYHTDTDDMIVTETVPGPDSDQRRYNNVDNAERKGLDFDISHKFSDQWDGYINYSREWMTSSEGEGMTSYISPEHIFHAGINYHYDKWSASLTTEYVSTRNAPGDISGVYLSYDEFFIANIGIAYQISPDCKATFNVSNLFDEEYYLWYAAPGRTFTLGLVYEF
ncbi:MAG: TonB-dependent receptor [Synergistaceae bacterium]|nr:TonB-dependent receptor [Synergistaceae bacterium]